MKMKKVLVLLLTCIMTAGSFGTVVSASTEDQIAAAQAQKQEAQAGLAQAQANISSLESKKQELEAYEDVADRFTQKEYMTMVKLLAILKVANALDRSHRQKFKEIKMSVRKGKLDIVVESSDSIVLEKGLFEEKADFFEEIFSIRPQIRERRIFL